jgi:hypothetical protein
MQHIQGGDALYLIKVMHCSAAVLQLM